ncbi:hypothetical protein [Williamsia muralis]|uniref:hypothetical protein n=1 Tax=Williamsia marianensis TaxID=85044 RepID=UPI003F5CF7FE
MHAPWMMKALAAGRIILGVTSLVAPRAFATAVGVVSPTDELSYMTRVYGARAVAMGTGYLTATPHEQARWAKLSLAIDISDTTAGIRQAFEQPSSRRPVALMIALTATYAAVGLAAARA